ncbi:MAG: hypothetical protein JWR26_168 [Pedosphaera sp.]|nr:hypothetical protein [Pedosphaera sp.]
MTLTPNKLQEPAAVGATGFDFTVLDFGSAWLSFQHQAISVTLKS